MLKLEDLQPGMPLVGLEPASVATIAAVVPIGEGSVQVFYRTPDGTTKERLLGRADEANLSVATVERPWSFDGDGEAFQLTCEAKRIDLAFLFDPMMAVHTSNVEPLPHQITAVYESMLPRQPLRFVLADDPGAGKTIMAGLYVRELVMRADAPRILVVAPGSLVEQWRDELFEKFGLEFRIDSSELEQISPSGNPFEDHHQLVVRLDQMSRNEELQDKLAGAGWDLVVLDEAHKLAAHYFGSKLEKTGRFRFAERLGAETRHLLLMTATPHNGKEEGFQLFLSLLDSDRFYGKFRDGVHKVDVSDLMRRMVKEELVKFDNTPLFPERKAYTVNYTLSQIEAALYEAVTDYVKTEMGKADELTGSRKGSVGFALAGGGAIPLEAQRLGLEAYASDLNPVAVLTNKAMIEIPPKFAGQVPVSLTQRHKATEGKSGDKKGKGAKGPMLPNLCDSASLCDQFPGARGLAEDVRFYGQWMRDEAFKRIGHLNPPIEITKAMLKERPDLKPYEGEKLTVIAWLWARTVRSPNPAFSHVEVPLANTFILSSKDGKEAYVQPVVGKSGYTFTVKVGKPPAEAKAGTSFGKQKGFRCLMSQTPMGYEYIREEALANRMGQKLMAVVAEGTRGRVYLSPTAEQEALAATAKPEWKPVLKIPDQALGFRLQLYGMMTFGDLFTPRQLVALTTFSDLVGEARERIRRDAVLAGMKDEGGGRRDEGGAMREER